MGPLSLAVRVALAGVILAVTLPQTVDGCSCIRQSHPQDYVCESDFVIVAQVRSMHRQPKKYTKYYKVIIKKQFHASDEAKVALKSGRLFTAYSSAACGAHLTLDETYLIVGTMSGSKKPYINMCYYIVPWKSVTMRQKKGFRLLYRMGCDCKIETCSYRRPCSSTVGNDTCQLTSHCQSSNSVCTRHPGGKCGWMQNKSFKECEKQYLSKTGDGW